MNLEQILADEQGQAAFLEFLKKEFNDENLQFWLQCQQFKKIKNKKQLKKCSEKIYSQFISSNGKNAVNIDHMTRRHVEEILRKPHVNMFEMAENQIFDLMQSDPFPRFLKSKIYKQYISTKNPEKTYRHEQNSSLIRKRKRLPEIDYAFQHTYQNEPIFTNQENIEPTYLQQTKNIENETNLNVPNPANFANDILCAYDDQYDNESLYCNAPIYSIDSPDQSSLKQHLTKGKNWKIDNQFIRFVFPDCSEEYVSTNQMTPIKQILIDLEEMIPSIVHLDIRVDKRSDFSIHFPEGYLVIAETASNKLPFFTIKSILKHFGIDWQDIELYDSQGNILNESLFMESRFDLNCQQIYVKYLSSLRTYINLNHIKDLNEDGVIIKSIQFVEYVKPSMKSSDNVKRSKMKTHLKSSSTIIVEADNNLTNKQNGTEPKHTYANVQKSIDLAELSFSNEMATEDFLSEILTTDISKLNFICTPNKRQKHSYESEKKYVSRNDNFYENINLKPTKLTNNHSSPIYKAHLMIVSDDGPDYENTNLVTGHQNEIGLPASQEDYFRDRQAGQTIKEPSKLYYDCDCDCQNSNILNPVNYKKEINLSSTVQRNNNSNSQQCHTPISFTKYLLHTSSQPMHQTNRKNNITPIKRLTNRNIPLSENNNFSNFCITPLKLNKPKLLNVNTNPGENNKRCQIRTLSQFHKIV
ncbi:Regulator of G protein signaling domain [Blomia tropicalis]|nr:Regulator of G protein signaling domain [Blomia tropicalis]